MNNRLTDSCGQKPQGQAIRQMLLPRRQRHGDEAAEDRQVLVAVRMSAAQAPRKLTHIGTAGIKLVGGAPACQNEACAV